MLHFNNLHRNYTASVIKVADMIELDDAFCEEFKNRNCEDLTRMELERLMARNIDRMLDLATKGNSLLPQRELLDQAFDLVEQRRAVRAESLQHKRKLREQAKKDFNTVVDQEIEELLAVA